MEALRIACRSSELSRAQFREFQGSFPEVPMVEFAYSSPGDRDKKTSLLNEEIPGDFFTRDLDHGVLSNEVDAALHSAKDIPWPLPRGLAVWYLGPRASAGDSLVSHQGYNLETLPQGARVGTSSIARREQILALRPDLEIVSIRGTIAERLEAATHLDGLIVAQCALERLGLATGSPLPFDTHPLQGHLALLGRLHSPLSELFSHRDVRRNYGMVSIAGAGPGNRELITLATINRLEQADIIFHDALIDQGILAGLKAELIFVGKRKSKHSASQDEINRMLYQAALAGKQVVRLKGGDPLILGRGSEEADYLSQRLISYEIIPGISAAQTAAAFAEIPLTERGKSASFSVSSGFPAEKIRWTQADTQAFYMAGSALDVLASKAAEHGASQQLIVAIHGAGSPGQRTIAASIAEAPFSPGFKQEDNTSPLPVLYLTGPSLNQRAGNGWFDRLPRVLYTGLTAPGSWETRRERASHVAFIEVKALGIHEIDQESKDAIIHPGRYDWVVFTSATTVAFWFEFWEAMGMDARAFGSTPIAAIGAHTAQALKTHGIRADLIPPETMDNSQGLAKSLIQWKCQQAAKPTPSILLPRSDKALKLLPDLLSQGGFQVKTATLYRTLAKDADAGELSDFQEIVFSSPSAVESFKSRYPRLGQELKVRLRGPQTAAAFTAAWPEHPDAKNPGAAG